MTRILWPRDPSTSLDTLYEYWQWCLTQYCPRNLTKGKDKLIAIQSVAEEMMSTTRWEYIGFAGIWRHKIKEELFWIFPFGEARKPDASRAPSWSWSALDGHVTFNPRILPKGKRSVPEPLAPIFDAINMEVIDVYPSREDAPSGEIHGFLEVKAWVRPILTVVKAKTVNDGEKLFPFKLVAGASHGSGENEHIFAHGRLDIDEPRGNARLLYLHIDIDKRLTGLILELVSEGTTRTGKSPAFWRRVGVAALFDDKRGFILSENLFGDETGRSKIVMV
ncbi:HET domain-containing protein [Fusarium sp. LHS14.1]|nr:HET domain-containing protein [Fusarium sp. LHS14.1]